jgi:prepilin peptidase CpaA
MILDLLRLLLFPTLMAFAASSDLLTMTISNRVSLLLIAGFFVLAIASGMGLTEIGWHIAAGATVLAISFTCFALGWIGGGDAKVAAATALWLGFEFLLPYLVIASALGGALTLALLVFRRWPLPYVFSGQHWLLRLHHPESGVPYGIALAAGALMIYPETPWIKAVELGRFIAG